MPSRDRRGSNVRTLPTPAHSIVAEQAVLGAMLADPDACRRAAPRVIGEDFYEARHRDIYRAILAVVAEGHTADAVSVAERLERDGRGEETGGLAYVGRLANETLSTSNVETHAAIVRDHAQRRRLRQNAVDLVHEIDESPERSTTEITSDWQQRLLHAQQRLRTGRGLVEASHLAGDLLDDLDRRARGERGLAIGLADFDAATNGLDPGDLVVIAGRPGMGKTALLVSIAAHVARETSVAVFSAEMPARQLMRRAVALVGEVPQSQLRDPEHLSDTDWSHIATAASTVGRLKLHIDDTPLPSLEHVRAECLSLKAREALGLVLVDYVQLVAGRGANRYEQLRDVAYGLKALAKDLGAPVVVLAQLNRGVEAREHKRPHVSDLRDSGAIEEAADVVALLYSEGYYDPDFAMPYVLECAIEKNRNGERKHCLWHFAGAYSRVQALRPGAPEEYRRLLAQRKAASRSRGASNDL